jgi:hypothetical protein
MLLTTELWQVAPRKRLSVCPTPVLMVQSVRKAGEPTFVNVWRAGVTRIAAKVSLHIGSKSL